MQSFAWADAKLCVRVGLNWHRNVCPILDKRKGKKDSPYFKVLSGHSYSFLSSFLSSFHLGCIEYVVLYHDVVDVTIVGFTLGLTHYHVLQFLTLCELAHRAER